MSLLFWLDCFWYPSYLLYHVHCNGISHPSVHPAQDFRKSITHGWCLFRNWASSLNFYFLCACNYGGIGCYKHLKQQGNSFDELFSIVHKRLYIKNCTIINTMCSPYIRKRDLTSKYFIFLAIFIVTESSL